MYDKQQNVRILAVTYASKKHHNECKHYLSSERGIAMNL